MNKTPLSIKRRDKTLSRLVPKKSPVELVHEFWNAHPLALFDQNVVAAVRGVSIATLENERWKGDGVAFRKISGRVLYRKSDVMQFLDSHALVMSTSEYKKNEDMVVKDADV
ncbi:MAG: DNA-binding protein [Gammaproteobacteria bacterium]|nr:DNA-binding protein [Gammaproteobacteria bacterium]